MRRIATVLVLLVIAVSCGDDSDDSGGSTTTASAGSTESTLAGETLALTSPAFAEGEMIPSEFAGCIDGGRGPNESPPLEWSDVPGSAVELAVTVVDPDADGFIHWIVAGIDPGVDG
ncbi:MAG: YbhB/YbcL family Raf kinase inhibitor-like protein, partial [Actinomycetota bacterium]